MRILLIGGTVFLGRHIADAALARGHTLTLFNRGKSNPELFPHIEKLRGARDGGLAPLDDRSWDAVVDTCGYVPRIVRASARAIARGRYCFVSTLSVYPDYNAPGLHEQWPTATIDDPTTERVTADTYGALKALCEREVDPARALIIRPGLIVGPHDPSDRFTYWVRPRRLAPGRPERRVQFIDARDLAAWIVALLEERATGVLNATGRPVPMSDVCGPGLTWVDDDFLLARGVAPYTDLPLWIPHADDDVRCARPIPQRPLADTIRDTRAWDDARPAGPRKAGLTPEREAELLAGYNRRP